MILWSPAGVRVLQSRPITCGRPTELSRYGRSAETMVLQSGCRPSRGSGLRRLRARYKLSACSQSHLLGNSGGDRTRYKLGPMLRHLNHFVVRNLASSASYLTMAAARFNRDCRSREMKQQILDRVANWCSSPAADDVSLVLVEIPCWPQHCARPS